MDLPLIDMTKLYAQGDSISLVKDCKTKTNKFKKGEKFVVKDVTKTTLYLLNENGGLTIHRFLNDLIEKTKAPN